ncbi:MAG: hypothetical protein R3C11_04070 [Planctomycetaceae bacterium]
METFDPKPALTEYAGLSINETPHSHVLNNPALEENLRVVVKDDANGKIWLQSLSPAGGISEAGRKWR